MSLPKVIVLATGKGGAGKSALTRSLAAHFLATKQRPAIVDADPQASIANLHDVQGPMGQIPVAADPEAETVQTTIAELAETHRPVGKAALKHTAAAPFHRRVNRVSAGFS